jgi:hypothetical protein
MTTVSRTFIYLFFDGIQRCGTFRANKKRPSITLGGFRPQTKLVRQLAQRAEADGKERKGGRSIDIDPPL